MLVINLGTNDFGHGVQLEHACICYAIYCNFPFKLQSFIDPAFESSSTHLRLFL
eukprot:COSAG06_NODE_15267_length_1084_cov_95.356345_1_plen_53_part_10